MENIVEIDIKDLVMCPLNIRALLFEKSTKNNKMALTAWDEEITSMAKTMKDYRTIVPLIVRKVDDKYEVVSGERRRQAASKAELDKLPCIVRDLTDEETLRLIVIEDEHRWEFNFFEKGKEYVWLKDGIDSGNTPGSHTRERLPGQRGGFAKIGEFSFKEIANMIGRSDKYVEQRYRIAKNLPEELSCYCILKSDDKEIDKNRFTVSKAYELAYSLDAQGKQLSTNFKIELAKKIMKEGWMRSDLGNSIEKYKEAQKILAEEFRDPIRKELEEGYLDPSITGIPMIMEKEVTLDKFKEERDRLLGNPVGEHPAEILGNLKKKLDVILKEVQEKGGTVIKADCVITDNTIHADIQWDLTLSEAQEALSLAEFPGTKFKDCNEAQEWAHEHGGYTRDRIPVQTGKGLIWGIMVKPSMLSEEEKNEILEVNKNEVKQ